MNFALFAIQGSTAIQQISICFKQFSAVKILFGIPKLQWTGIRFHFCNLKNLS